ncbi:MAG: hypothetical protein KZQ96_22430 [Candidatus Thiodiazotropha sp. (ex Lucinoma borealis)]|nr:hypothetical protein [Candidatus Thiodiazotropha sp. (ex Lucinoma borealis)]
MIISHKYKFIFVKTRKVGGTSLEIALSKHLGEDDIVTLIAEEKIREERGYKTGRHYKKSIFEIRPSDIIQWLGQCIQQLHRSIKLGVKFNRPARPRKFAPHMTAKEIRDTVGKDIWDSYFKFTIERNPWDMVVSYYYFWMKHNCEIPFEKFVKNGTSQNATNLPFYTDGDDILVDKVIRYEDLDASLAEISKLIGYPENIADIMKDISTKSHIRQERDYHKLYNEETKEIVANQFAREIKMYDYKY